MGSRMSVMLPPSIAHIVRCSSLDEEATTARAVMASRMSAATPYSMSVQAGWNSETVVIWSATVFACGL